jgi:hypothetical protein
MTRRRVIRIEGIRFDPLDARFEGVAVLRGPDGGLTRRRLRAPGDPAWSHCHAARALGRRLCRP